MSKVVLNTEQAKAAVLIVEFYKNFYKDKENAQKIFALAGYAGTGKTFLISHIIKTMLHLKPEEVSFVTPTGKAASLLIQKGLHNTSTLHRKIYVPYMKQMIKESSKSPTGEEAVDLLRFSKKNLIFDDKLMVVDEGSMVSKRQIEDLLSYGVPILIVGDPFQLPPVQSEEHDLFDNPDHTLTQIVRQADGNPIITVATMVREGKEVYPGMYGDKVMVVDYATMSREKFTKLVMKSDQVICGFNSTKDSINAFVRLNKGITTKFPVDGDKVICTRNNYSITLDEEGRFSLVNGLMGNLVNVNVNEKEGLATFNFKPDFLSYHSEELVGSTMRFVYGTSAADFDETGTIYTLDNGDIVRQYDNDDVKEIKKARKENKDKFYEMLERELEYRKQNKKTRMISYFDYGYCISVHKSQGSEWPNTLLIDERTVMGSVHDRNRWLYTGITRAKEKLLIIKNFKNNIL